MATSKYQMSVKGFQSLYETVTRKGAFRCHGINKNDTQCKRRIRASKKALSIICEDIIELLRQGTGDVQHLLTQASSMVMCIQNHQAQAARQFKTWMEMINSLQDQLSLEEDEIKVGIPQESSILLLTVVSQICHYPLFRHFQILVSQPLLRTNMEQRQQQSLLMPVTNLQARQTYRHRATSSLMTLGIYPTKRKKLK